MRIRGYTAVSRPPVHNAQLNSLQGGGGLCTAYQVKLVSQRSLDGEYRLTGGTCAERLTERKEINNCIWLSSCQGENNFIIMQISTATGFLKSSCGWRVLSARRELLGVQLGTDICIASSCLFLLLRTAVQQKISSFFNAKNPTLLNAVTTEQQHHQALQCYQPWYA